MSKVKLLVLMSAGLGVVGAVASVLMHGPNPFLHPSPMMELSPGVREATSTAVGLGFGAVMVLLSRIASRYALWARRLHQDLRPVALLLSPSMIVVVALLSGLSEELLFRSFLVPWVGVVPQAIVFGLLHQVSGPSRWVWMVWAAGVGLVFGLMYEVFGTLSGPVVAHALINGLNLRFMRSTDPFVAIAD